MTTVSNTTLLVNEAQEFITVHRVSTHLGYRFEIGTTTSMDAATPMNNIEHRTIVEIARMYPNCTQLPVRITREVKVVTEELNFNLSPIKEKANA
jgi:hypothetical protein